MIQTAHGHSFFGSELEPCVKAHMATADLFQRNVGSVVDRTLSEQLLDGGWNCGARRADRSLT